MGSYSLSTNIEIVDENNSTQQGEIYYFIEISYKNVFIVQNGVIRQFEKVQSYNQDKKEHPNDLLVSIDFADWVADTYYRNFGKRVSWFREIPVESGIDITDPEMVLIPSGTLFRKAEGKSTILSLMKHRTSMFLTINNVSFRRSTKAYLFLVIQLKKSIIIEVPVWMQ